MKKTILSTAGIVLVLASLILGVLFFSGYWTTTLAVGPQRPVGLQGTVGPGAVNAGPVVTRVEPNVGNAAPHAVEAGPDVTEVGPNVAGVERGTDTKVIFGFDWVFMVACGLVLAALGFGVAVGLGTRKQLLQQ
jgi:hypothetical protein